MEPNNTGTTDDDPAVHARSAERLAKDSYATTIADRLAAPLLVPTFPRPASTWRAYTHALDDDTLRIDEGVLERVDLQLLAMIDDAIALLRRHELAVEDDVFMHGFSASGTFTNRFAVLHPARVRAVASGGVNAIRSCRRRRGGGRVCHTRSASPTWPS